MVVYWYRFCTYIWIMAGMDLAGMEKVNKKISI